VDVPAPLTEVLSVPRRLGDEVSVALVRYGVI
jgi:hypothetical protein